MTINKNWPCLGRLQANTSQQIQDFCKVLALHTTNEKQTRNIPEKNRESPEAGATPQTIAADGHHRCHCSPLLPRSSQSREGCVRQTSTWFLASFSCGVWSKFLPWISSWTHLIINELIQEGGKCLLIPALHLASNHERKCT